MGPLLPRKDGSMIHHLVLAIDPITAIAIGSGIAGLAGAAAPLLASKPKAPPLPLTPPTPAPANQPQGSQTSSKAGMPSFLAAAATPPQQNVGGKTLLGQ